jgi:hypothetical protein
MLTLHLQAGGNMSDSTPQFGTAEYLPSSGTETCKSCKQTLSGRYFRINGALACERCTEQLKTQLPKDTHSAFVRGLLLGIGGAIVGLVLYSAFVILLRITIGYASLAVGFIVGKAIRLGSGGIGGRRYQVAALLLTYSAVSISAVPISIAYYIREQKTKPPAVVVQPSSRQPGSSASGTSPENSSAPQDPSGSPSSVKPKAGLAAVLIGLAILGLTSPFMALADPLHGLIGLVILFVGLQIAWKLTGAPKVDILGPFTVGASTAPPALG